MPEKAGCIGIKKALKSRHTGLTDDHKNAARAFVEKTQPVFEGK